MIPNLQPYPAYKDSGVPWLAKVPAHWEVIPGRALFQEINDRDHAKEELLSVTIARGVVRQADLLSDSSKKDSSNEDKGTYKLVQPGDIAYNKMRAWQGAVGFSAWRGIVSPAYIVQRSRSAENSPRYLHYLLRTPGFAAEAERWSYGITSDQWSLRSEDFKRIYFAAPEPVEQTAITRFLDWADRRIRRVIRARQKRIRLLEEYKQALIHRAVTGQIDVRTGRPYPAYKDSGVEWLGEVPAHWQVTRLKFVAGKIVDCLHATPQYSESGEFSAIRTADISPGIVRLDSARRVNADVYRQWTQRLEPVGGDVLYSREGERFGIAACVPDGARLCISQRMMVFRIRSEHNPVFVMWLLNSPQVYAQAFQDIMGATAPHVNIFTIKNYAISVPSRSEQDAIVAHINKITSNCVPGEATAKTEIHLLQELRTRLIADVVTGKLDVREAAARLPEEGPELEEAELLEDEVVEGEDDGAFEEELEEAAS